MANLFVAKQLLSITRDYNGEKSRRGQRAALDSAGRALTKRDERGWKMWAVLNLILTNIFHEILPPRRRPVLFRDIIRIMEGLIEAFI